MSWSQVKSEIEIAKVKKKKKKKEKKEEMDKVKIKERKGVLCGETLSHKCKILMDGKIKQNMQQKRFSGKNM